MRNAINPMQRLGIALIVLVSAIPIAAQNTYDARIIEYAGLRFACGPVATPSLKIRNVGTAAMGTCVVETWKNGLLVNSFNWVLAVPALEGETRQPSLPAILGIGEGDALEFRIISVNGQPDEDADGNIQSVLIAATPVEAPTHLMHVVLGMPAAPDSLVWSITNGIGQVIAQGGPYTEAADLDTWVELGPASCYMVRFAEEGADPVGVGELSVLSDGQILASMTAGTATEPSRAGLFTGASLGLAEVALGSISIAPNPATAVACITLPANMRKARISILDAQGRMVHETTQATQGAVEVDLRSFSQGVYAVQAIAQGMAMQTRLLVER